MVQTTYVWDKVRMVVTGLKIVFALSLLSLVQRLGLLLFCWAIYKAQAVVAAAPSGISSYQCMYIMNWCVYFSATSTMCNVQCTYHMLIDYYDVCHVYHFIHHNVMWIHLRSMPWDAQNTFSLKLCLFALGIIVAVDCNHSYILVKMCIIIIITIIGKHIM